MEKNLFENVEIVCPNDPNVNPCDLVYISDEDELRSDIPTIQISIREKNHPVTQFFSADSDDDNDIVHPINVKINETVSAEEDQLFNRTKSPDIFIKEEPEISFSDQHDFLEFIPPMQIEVPNGNVAVFEEQFQIINDPPEEPEPDKNTSVDENKDTSILDSSNSSSSSSTSVYSNVNNDHSYSQQSTSATYCDGILQGILVESNLCENSNALRLLTSYTNIVEMMINEDVNSQLSSYLKQMKTILQDKITNQPVPSEDQTNNNLNHEAAKDLDNSIDRVGLDDKDIINNDKSLLMENENDSKDEKEDNHQNNEEHDHDNEKNDQKNEGENDLQNENEDKTLSDDEDEVKEQTSIENENEMLIDDIDIKEEFIMQMEVDEEKNENIENDNNINHSNIEQTFHEQIDVLKSNVKRIHEMCIDVQNTSQCIIDSVFTSQDDIDNGKSKFINSLRSFLVINKQFLESENIDISRQILSTSSNVSQEKLDKSFDAEDEQSDGDGDSEIERLLNFDNLSRGKKKDAAAAAAVALKPEAVSNEVKRRKKKVKKNDSASSNISSESSGEEDYYDSSKDSSKETDLSDEEEKLNKKRENDIRDRLLASTSEEDDESESISSQSSDDDDERSEKRDANKKEKLAAAEKKEDVDNKSDIEKKSPPKNEALKREPIIIMEKQEVRNEDLQEKTDKEQDKQKASIKIKRTESEREIFKKSFCEIDLLDDDEQPKNNVKKPQERSQYSRNHSSDKIEIETNGVDLTAFENREVKNQPSLNDFIEKRLKNVDVVNTPTKNLNDTPSTAPSPSLDDIELISISSESDSEISSTKDEVPGRRRKQLTEEELKEETKKAKKEETERIKKLEKKNNNLTQYLSQRLSQEDVVSTGDLVLDVGEKSNIQVTVHPKIVDRLKDHQKDGVKFMYDNCYGTIDDVKADNGSGCILAHCMGLGKTLQLITLLHTIVRYPELHTQKILIICPKSTIFNWYDEFNKWLSGVEGNLKVTYLEENLTFAKRIEIIKSWHEHKKPGIFLINYESFRLLALWNGSQKRAKNPIPESTVKEFQSKISKYLLDPGPHLVVCDEGHIIKNAKSATNRAITKISTRRRIILTGTPVQNALAEYHSMVQWIKPNFLGTIQEFNNIYANPIKDGQNKDSTPQEIKKMKQKSFILNNVLSKFVQRKEASVLREFLPMKYEYCVFVPLTEPQEKLYNYFLSHNMYENEQVGKHLLPIYTALRKIWTHPKVLQHAYERARKGEVNFKNKQNSIINNIQQKNKKIQEKSQLDDGEVEEPDDIHDTCQGVTAVTENWWSNILFKDDMDSIFSSHKMILLFEILSECEKNREKVLIFSGFVAVLDIVEKFMKEINNRANNPKAEQYGLNKFAANWEFGKDYYRIDGSVPRNTRHQMINKFNEPNPRLRCFLINTYVGGQGINLIGANRCILIDTSWNPATDNQNIFRIYRLGQPKTCFVYRFVSCGTMEEKIYSRSVTKEAMSHRVVEKKQVDRHYVRAELSELFTPYSLKPREVPNIPSDNILKRLLHNCPRSAHKFHEHDSLLENKPDQDLSEAEKNEAWDAYEHEVKANANRLVIPPAMLNNNNFAKNADLMKYNNMAATFSNWQHLTSSFGLGGANMDPTGLAAQFYPLSPNMYSNDFLKRLTSYDPFYTASLSTTLATSTSSTSPLLPLLDNPISALGNLAAASTIYNANTIPPAPNSMFASPSFNNITNLPQTSSIAPTSSSLKLKLHKGTFSSVNTTSPSMSKPSFSSINTLGKKPKSSTNQNSGETARNREALIVMQKKAAADQISKRQLTNMIASRNSSMNLSILPDVDGNIGKTSTNGSSSSSSSISKNDKTGRTIPLSNSGTSARTNYVPNKTTNSLVRPNVLKKATPINLNSSALSSSGVIKQVVTTQGRAVLNKQGNVIGTVNRDPVKVVNQPPIQKPQPNRNLILQPVLKKQLQQVMGRNPLTKSTLSNPLVVSKPVAVNKPPAVTAATISPVTTSTTDLMRQIQRHNSGLMIDTTAKNFTPQKKLPPTQNSISITKISTAATLPSPTVKSSASLIKTPSSLSVLPASTSQRVVLKSPHMNQSNIINAAEATKSIKQGIKRQTESAVHNALKKIKLTQPMNPTQQTNSQANRPANSQQFSQKQQQSKIDIVEIE